MAFLLCGQSAAQRLRQHRLQQPPALLIGLAELLLQLVAEGHQVGPNSGKQTAISEFATIG